MDLSTERTWSPTHLRDGSPKHASGWLRYDALAAAPVAEEPVEKEPVAQKMDNVPSLVGGTDTTHRSSSSSSDSSSDDEE
jgi:hypothetical protein